MSFANGDYHAAMERIAKFLDENSFVELSALSECGVVTGYGTADGRLVYTYSQYGAVNAPHADKIARLYDLAVKMGAPVVGILDSKGAELAGGVSVLDAYGKIFKCMSDCSGVVPQVAVIGGECMGASAFIPAMSDFVIMPESGASFMLQSPATLSGADSKRTAPEVSNGAAMQKSGVVHLTAKTEEDALASVKQLLDYLPSNNLDEAPVGLFVDDLNRMNDNISSEDARGIIKTIADNNVFLEISAGYAEEMVAGLLRLNGCSVGVLANNGAITVNAAEKAVGLINFCDAFSIPLLTLTSVNGYEYGLQQQRDMLKYGAKLAYSFAQATVPTVNVVTGDSAGSPYLFMNSKHIGADISYVWKTANITIANPRAAEAAAGVKVEGGTEYADNAIEPSATRKMVIAAFEMLNSKRVSRLSKKHGSAIV